MKILTGKKQTPRRCLLYGVHGIGKSTWAAQAPNVLMMDLEDGLADIDTSKTQHLTTMDEIEDAFLWLAQQEHGFTTLAIDSADWLERIIHQRVAQKNGKATVGDIPYGNGYKQALGEWQQILKRLDYLRNERGLNIVLLAHSKVSKFADPAGDSYDRYTPALHEASAALLQEWVDELLFCHYKVHTRKEDEGFGRERTIAVGGTERTVKTSETATALAKNRLAMPAEIGFSWAAYAQHMAGNISGIVVDGSSKSEE